MRIAFAGLVAGGLAATAAWAQTPAPPPAPPMAAGMAAPGQAPDARWAQHRAEMEARHAAREAEREADLALLLDLKGSQRALLHAYLVAMHPPHRMMDGAPDGPGQPPHDRPPVGEHDEAFGAQLAGMRAEFDRSTREEQARLGTAKAFYAALDAAQRAKFEAIRRLDHPHGPPPMMGREGPHGPHGGERGRGPGGPDMPPPPPPPGDMPPPNGL